VFLSSYSIRSKEVKTRTSTAFDIFRALVGLPLVLAMLIYFAVQLANTPNPPRTSLQQKAAECISARLQEVGTMVRPEEIVITDFNPTGANLASIGWKGTYTTPTQEGSFKMKPEGEDCYLLKE
jgi:hypothetical protein